MLLQHLYLHAWLNLQQRRSVMVAKSKPARNAALVAMRKAGKSWREIGREFNLHHITARRIYERWADREETRR